MRHPTHSPELPALNRIGGQIEGIKNMIEQQRYCVDILTQLHAIKAAIKSVEANILERHLSACVHQALHEDFSENAEVKIKEIKDLFKKYL